MDLSFLLPDNRNVWVSVEPLVYRAQFMALGFILSLTFCLLTDGGCAPTPLLPFRVRAIQSFVGHAISIVSNSNMVATPKQQWDRMRLVYFVCVFVFLLYVPSQQLWSWRDGQFSLPHFFPGQA